MIQYIDIGVNLFDKQFHGKQAIIEKNSYENQIGFIITGTSVKSSIQASDYVKGKNGIFCTAGVHPHSAKSCDEQTICTLRNLILTNPNIVAVGECGLDYNRMFSEKETQKYWFERQVELAEECKRPLFLHERSAEDDFLRILKKHPEICKHSVVHCFTGNRGTVSRYLRLGCFIGITGWICDERRNTDLKDAIKIIPLNRLMIETDSPYLLPRGCGLKSPNLPIYLPYVLQEIESETVLSSNFECKREKIRGVEEETLRKQVFENTKSFFSLSFPE